MPPRRVPAHTCPCAAEGISIAVIAVPSSTGETGCQSRPLWVERLQTARTYPKVRGRAGSIATTAIAF